MKHEWIVAFSLGMALAIPTQADNPLQPRDPAQKQERDSVYGAELMTGQERVDYHRRMRAAKTAQEREAIRLEHHKKMQARAKVQGKTLPDVPPEAPGMGPGKGLGGGMGPGYGR